MAIGVIWADIWNESIWNTSIWAQSASNQAPVIGAQTFYALDGATAGQASFQVVASDPDEDSITYLIVAGNTNTDWQIHSTTGVLSNLNTLDEGTTPTYNLTIRINDGTTTTDGPVTVNVQDYPAIDGYKWAGNVFQYTPAPNFTFAGMSGTFTSSTEFVMGGAKGVMTSSTAFVWAGTAGEFS